MNIGAPVRDGVRVPAQMPPPEPPATPEQYADMPAALEGLMNAAALPGRRLNHQRTLGHIVRVLQRRGATHVPVMYWSKSSHELAGHICSSASVLCAQARGTMPGGAPIAPGRYGAIAGCEEAAIPPHLRARHVATDGELWAVQTDHAMALAYAMGGAFRRIAITGMPVDLPFPSLNLADLSVS
jgi:hypothetical protein